MSEPIDKRKAIARMSELLRSGAIMLSEKCPVKGCTMPLFRLRTGETICPVHGRVYVVRSDEEARDVVARVSASQVLNALEKRVVTLLGEAADGRRDLDYRELIGWLEVLERIRRIKKELGAQAKP